MYRFLDRPLDDLHAHDRMLVSSMRHWVRAASTGRCPCTAAAAGFRHEGVDPALPDFNMAMAVLNAEALASLSFAPLCAGQVGEDEACLLALFAADSDIRRHRHASQLVHPHAVATLATAVDRVTAVMRAIDPREPAPRSQEH